MELLEATDVVEALEEAVDHGLAALPDQSGTLDLDPDSLVAPFLGKIGAK